MQVNILYRPAHTMAQIWLAPNESVIAESGAMVGMSPNVQIQTSSGGGLMKGLKRLFGGESFFRNTFTAAGGNGEVLLAHSLCGDMATLEMNQAGYFIQNSCYIASSPGVEIDSKWKGAKGFFSGSGAFTLKATAQGPGQVIIGAFGGLQEIPVNGDFVIDTGHLVAWDASLTYKVGKSGAGWIASFLSGEGLVCHFKGQGRVWIQTRNAVGYGQEIGAMLPPRKE
jgi:uncharacterized protein (TIGR00266 family)